MNYQKLQEKALTLLTQHGRAITVRKIEKGEYNSETDTYSKTITEYNTYGVIENYSYKEISVVNNAGMIKIGDKKLILGVNSSLPELTGEIDWNVIIDNEIWDVLEIKPLKPALIVVLYEIQIRKVQ